MPLFSSMYLNNFTMVISHAHFSARDIDHAHFSVCDGYLSFLQVGFALGALPTHACPFRTSTCIYHL